MKKLLYLLIILPALLIAQNNESHLLTINEITVKQGQNAQFMDGVKKWKECYLENKGSDKWNMWRRIQGEGTVYVLTGNLANWAEMDKKDEASKKCRSIVSNFIMPNVKSTNYSISRSIPKVSRSTPLEGSKLVWVSFFRVKNSIAFNELVKEVTSTYAKAKGQPSSFWYSFMGGGPESPDYFVSTPFKNYADLDVKKEGVWKVYEKTHGKKKTDATRAKVRNAIENSWSYLYSLDEKMSN